MKNSKVCKAVIGILLSIVIFLVLFSVSLPAADSATDIIERVQKKYAEINDAILHFSQKVKFNLSKAEYTSSGTLYMKKTNHYRIVTEDRTFVTDGKTVWSTHQRTSKSLLTPTKRNRGVFLLRNSS
jgi:outer membrane lipoprotein-sorting protein